jgi:hypothetical protein
MKISDFNIDILWIANISFELLLLNSCVFGYCKQRLLTLPEFLARQATNYSFHHKEMLVEVCDIIEWQLHVQH